MEAENTTTASAAEQWVLRGERSANEVVLRFPSPNRLLRALLPPDAVQHMYAAQREQLLALRSVIDAAITRIEEAEREGGPGSRPRRTEITIE
jgi:hypothetical protein